MNEKSQYLAVIPDSIRVIQVNIRLA